MCKKCFLTFIGILFSAKVVFIAAFWISTGTISATINNWTAPTWLFYIGIIADTILAIWAFKLVLCCGKHECKIDTKKKR
jgi:hypothetical protein